MVTTKQKVLIGVVAGASLALLKAIRVSPDVLLDLSFWIGMLLVAALFILISTIFAYFSKETTFPRIFKDSLLAPSIVAALIPGAGVDQAAVGMTGLEIGDRADVQTSTWATLESLSWDGFIAQAHADTLPPVVAQGRPVRAITKDEFEPTIFQRTRQILGLSRAPKTWTYVVSSARDSAEAAAIVASMGKLPGINTDDIQLIRPQGQSEVLVTIGQFNAQQALKVNEHYHAYFIADTLRTQLDSVSADVMADLRTGKPVDLRTLVRR